MKTFLVAALLVLIADAALAQSDSGPRSFTVQYQPQCIKNLSRVAHRLHVAPTTEASLLVATSCDNRQYDIVRLIEALLDRMDKVEKTK